MRNKKIKKLVVLVIKIIIIIGLGGLFAFLTDTNQKHWTSSPVGASFSYSSRMYTVSSNGSVDTSVVTSNNGLRPVISITPNAVISSGDGTSTNPYTVQTN